MSRAPLRILQLNSIFNGGGADNQTLELAAGLRELGDDVTLAIARGSRLEPRARQMPELRVETFFPKRRAQAQPDWQPYQITPRGSHSNHPCPSRPRLLARHPRRAARRLRNAGGDYAPFDDEAAPAKPPDAVADE